MRKLLLNIKAGSDYKAGQEYEKTVSKKNLRVGLTIRQVQNMRKLVLKDMGLTNRQVQIMREMLFKMAYLL